MYFSCGVYGAEDRRFQKKNKSRKVAMAQRKSIKSLVLRLCDVAEKYI
jgi:hypothetical protein